MNAKKAKKIIRIRFHNLVKHYTDMRTKMEAEGIHKFRVEIKKLRAFLRLISATYGKKIKIPGSLKKIYRAAGILRDWQVHHQTMQKARKDDHDKSAYGGHIRKKMARAEKELGKIVQQKILHESQHAIERRITKKINDKVMYEFFKKKFMRVRAFSYRFPVTDTKLHSVRKNIKDILYNAAVFEKELHRRFPARGWNRKKKLFYTSLADELGHFQDCTVELSHLRASKHKLTRSEKKVAASLLLQKEHLKQKIILALETHCA